jgi:hypothetical protein
MCTDQTENESVQCEEHELCNQKEHESVQNEETNQNQLCQLTKPDSITSQKENESELLENNTSINLHQVINEIFEFENETSIPAPINPFFESEIDKIFDLIKTLIDYKNSDNNFLYEHEINILFNHVCFLTLFKNEEIKNPNEMYDKPPIKNINKFNKKLKTTVKDYLEVLNIGNSKSELKKSFLQVAADFAEKGIDKNFKSMYEQFQKSFEICIAAKQHLIKLQNELSSSIRNNGLWDDSETKM